MREVSLALTLVAIVLCGLTLFTLFRVYRHLEEVQPTPRASERASSSPPDGPDPTREVPAGTRTSAPSPWVSPAPTALLGPRPTSKVHLAATAKPSPPRPVGHTRTGVATWYDNGRGFYAAAGPALRVGRWRGRTVKVEYRGRVIWVRLTDWCACGKRDGHETLLDLSRDAFDVLEALNMGVIPVTVSW